MFGSSGGDGGDIKKEEVGIVADVVDAPMVSSVESPSVLVDVGAGAVGLTTGHVFPSSSSAKKGSAPFFSIVEWIGRKNSTCLGMNSTVVRDLLGNKPDMALALSIPSAI